MEGRSEATGEVGMEGRSEATGELAWRVGAKRPGNWHGGQERSDRGIGMEGRSEATGELALRGSRARRWHDSHHADVGEGGVRRARDGPTGHGRLRRPGQ